jgi:hypothetical protein
VRSLADPLPTLGDGDVAVLLASAVAGLALIGQMLPNYLRARTGYGLASLELAHRPSRARRIVDAWCRRSADGAAKRSLLTDLPFIALYVAALVTATILIEHAARATGVHDAGEVRLVVRWGTAAALAAGACDLAEDVGLTVTLFGRPLPVLVPLTALFAATKFLLLAGLAAALVAIVLVVALCCAA